MIFTDKSIVVCVWVDAIKRGDKNLEDVPKLSNLNEIVTKIIKGDVKYV